MCAALVCFSIAASAQTPPFGGTISFDGVAHLDNSIGSANKFTGIFGISGPSSLPQVIYQPAGGYTPVPVGAPVTFDSFTFGPTLSSAGNDFTLWSFSEGTTNYSFEVTSETYLSQTCDFLNISGAGTAFVDGFACTNATWKITVTGDGPNLTFGESTTVLSPSQTPVPEPSSLLLLMPPAVLGCLFKYRRFRLSRV